MADNPPSETKRSPFTLKAGKQRTVNFFGKINQSIGVDASNVSECVTEDQRRDEAGVRKAQSEKYNKRNDGALT